MTTLLSLLPEDKVISTEDLCRDLAVLRNTQLAPASQEAKDFCAILSQHLLNDTAFRASPALQALGYWLRPTSVAQMLEQHLDAKRQASGTVFAITPGNIDTLFAYIAAIGLLSGNTVIIRISQRSGPEAKLLLDLFKSCLATAPAILRKRIHLLRYDHNDAITNAISAQCDTRLVWGGDETVKHIAGLPRPAVTQEYGFSDKFSLATIKADSYQKLAETERDRLAQSFFNDVYMFDQLACASPRLIYWVGDVERAADDFYHRITNIATARNYQPDIAENLAKLNTRFLAFHDLDVAACKVYSPALTIIHLRSMSGVDAFKSINWGFGLLLAAELPNLTALAPQIGRRDQTLSHWGFDENEISALKKSLPSGGINRIVPIGQALSFDAVWDGVNLFEAMTK